MPTTEPLPPPPDASGLDASGRPDPRAHLGLAGLIAKKYLDRGVDLDDLVQVGMIGIMTAARKFDPAWPGPDGTPIAFSTYACGWAESMIRRAVWWQGDVIRIPGHLHEQLNSAAASTLDVARLKPGERENLAQAAIVRELLWTVGVARQGSATGTWLADTVADPHDHDPAATLVRDEQARALTAAIDLLDERAAEVIRRHWGLDGGEPETLKAIGESRGAGKEWAWRIERRALKRLERMLRGTMKEEEGNDREP